MVSNLWTMVVLSPLVCGIGVSMVVTGKSVSQFGSSQDFTQAVIVAPDKTRLLTLANDGSASLFELASGKRLAEFRGHTKRILAAAWHNQYLATSSIDGAVRVWEIASGKALVVFARPYRQSRTRTCGRAGLALAARSKATFDLR